MSCSDLDFIFNIPDENFERLKQDIEKLSKKNEKAGLPPIFIMPIGFKDERNGQNLIHRTWEVMISGESLTIEGWDFVGRIDYDRISGNMIYATPGKTVPDVYQTIDSICEHCNHTRKRNTGYVIVKDGEYKVVGSTCISKFFNSLTPEKIAKYYETIRRARNYCGKGSTINSDPIYSGVDLKSYMNHVLSCIKSHGWMGATQAKQTGQPHNSTANIAYTTYNAGLTVAHDTVVDDILDWAGALTDDEVVGNTFLNNIRVIARDGLCRVSDLNYVAAMVNTYLKKKNPPQTISFANSQHVGKVGDTVDMSVTVVKSVVVPDGSKKIVKLVDDGGNLYTWFNHGSTILVKDQTYQIKGRIIAHNTYNNIKETILTRVKLKKPA